MSTPNWKRQVFVVVAILLSCLLSACGGGGSSDTSSQQSDAASSSASASDSSSPDSSSSGPDSSSPSGSVGNTPTTTAVTEVKVVNTGSGSQSSVPLTFGQVFRPGDVPQGDSMTLALSDGTAIPYQMDVKARNADGSIRHAIFSATLPQLPAGQTDTITLSKSTAASSASADTTPTALLDAGFTASVNITIGSTVYSASADELLHAGSYTTWLSGPVVNEWLVSAPLKTAGNTEHPHLRAYFAIRSYTGLNKARVDVTVENDWTYQPDPQNITYDVNILVGGKSVYSKTGLTHYRQARWRKIFWWGTAPEADVAYDIPYLLSTKAVPNYDVNLQIAPTALSTMKQQWDNSNLPASGASTEVIDAGSVDHVDADNAEPMWPGIVYPRMSNVGGRADIAPMPRWAVLYLLTMDRDAKRVNLGLGDLAGTWPIHYRDKTTGLPVSMDDHPRMTLLGHPGDAINLATGQNDYFPACSGICSAFIPDAKFSPMNLDPQCYSDPTYANTQGTCSLQPETNHEPSLAYLPYLITGDHYYLEELQFWANWNLFVTNPAYHEYEKSLVKDQEVRGQAWSLRTLGQAAYITPDNDSMKQYFVDRVGYNLKFYNDTYTNGNPNQLGVIDGSPAGGHAFGAILYPTPPGPQTGVAPWQDDFFTWTVGYLADLGFTDATPLLKWKAKFSVGRLTAQGYCWIDGATYELAVRPTSSSPLYTTFADAYQATMRNADGTPMTNSTGALYLDQPCGSQAQADWRTQYDKDNGTHRNPWEKGEMTGYATDTEGFPSNMQPALAAAADSGIPNANAAWGIFISRPLKPDYSSDPQWDIIPRN